MQIKPEAFQLHKFTLINPTTSDQYCDFCTTSSHFFVADVLVGSTQNAASRRKSLGCLVEVKPQTSIQVGAMYHTYPCHLFHVVHISSFLSSFALLRITFLVEMQTVHMSVYLKGSCN